MGGDKYSLRRYYKDYFAIKKRKKGTSTFGLDRVYRPEDNKQTNKTSYLDCLFIYFTVSTAQWANLTTYDSILPTRIPLNLDEVLVSRTIKSISLSLA